MSWGSLVLGAGQCSGWGRSASARLMSQLHVRSVPDCRVHSGMLSSTPGFHPPEVSSTLPRCDRKVSRRCQTGDGGTVAWLRDTTVGDSFVKGQGCPATKWQNSSHPELRRGVPSPQRSVRRIKLVSASSVFLALKLLTVAARTRDESGQASLELSRLWSRTWSSPWSSSAAPAGAEAHSS